MHDWNVKAVDKQWIVRVMANDNKPSHHLSARVGATDLLLCTSRGPVPSFGTCAPPAVSATVPIARCAGAQSDMVTGGCGVRMAARRIHPAVSLARAVARSERSVVAKQCDGGWDGVIMMATGALVACLGRAKACRRVVPEIKWRWFFRYHKWQPPKRSTRSNGNMHAGGKGAGS